VCDPLYSGGALLRVHGEAAADGRLVAVVRQVFGSVYGATELRVGERVAGAIVTERPCAQHDPLPELAESELFVLFLPGNDGGFPNCEAFQSCAAQRCSGLSQPALDDCWNDCSAETSGACAENRSAALLNGAFPLLVPWQDELDFGDAHRLPSSEISALSSPESCLERFPYGPVPPCNDNVTACSSSPGSHTPTGVPWLGLIVGLVLVGLARRVGRPTSASL
jgi:hypothetical protein